MGKGVHSGRQSTRRGSLGPVVSDLSIPRMSPPLVETDSGLRPCICKFLNTCPGEVHGATPLSEIGKLRPSSDQQSTL